MFFVNCGGQGGERRKSKSVGDGWRLYVSFAILAK